MKKKLLEVRNISIGIKKKSKTLILVENVSFDIKEDEILGIVGESGCGKSLVCKAILGLLPNKVEILSGEIWFMGSRIDDDKRKLSSLRGKEMTMVFQEPTKSLHPLKTVGKQIGEVLKIHSDLSKKQIREKVIEIMESVGIQNSQKRINQYPHQLSGGLCQRIVIGISIAMNPSLIIADEPTTALDVTVQKKILDLIKKLNKDMRTSILMISHDIGVVSQISDRVCVMYCGQIVEEGKVPEIFKNPKHPYNKALLNTIPSVDSDIKELVPIEGIVPTVENYPAYCRFYDRCTERTHECKYSIPNLVRKGDGYVRCSNYR